jgi:hypothetical protein
MKMKGVDIVIISDIRIIGKGYLQLKSTLEPRKENSSTRDLMRIGNME